MTSNVRVVMAPRAERKYHKVKPDSFRNVTDRQMMCEIATYIAAQEAAGISFDCECQELVYSDEVVVLLHKDAEVWLITKILVLKPVVSFSPVYIWSTVKRGAWTLLVKVVARWRVIRGGAVLVGQ